MIPTLFKKLLFARQFHYEDGRFYLMMNVPGAIIPLRVLVLYTKELLKEKKEQVIYNIGFNQGYQAGKRYKTYAVSNWTGFLNFITELGETLGLGKGTFLKATPKEIVMQIHPSPFAEVWRKEVGKKRKVCYYIAGSIAGTFSGFTGKKWMFNETKCVANGDPACILRGVPHVSTTRKKN